ncbi:MULTISPECIES: bifunctional diaminohydroxyphosphoribosylaminopyrimidine deaminase/5-amino-6-(5-phosphoribosylamino)uracil reductase RibD [Curtobacterium]|uniref:Riboflavin biosynthesis protein RibD n=1 Tax=Curtobacterium oceanosedimentum TaxID=465820 RepID=A0A147DQQ0_9MICO|nr:MULTISPECIES: bifunctional diaminohydroxyphosphoribosylaminopyrimidine deaminase/5-amino-6-(5-phosphoribosylamino)uracil reductase RibD [Curtobacterium]KTR51905.1 DeoR faimly transcriptional regulator [Curtobacterium oceanosedimentum]UBQ04179.1 bifunctional diaminohydroxyphosphoribosylaminopyrimidine deaminase/5-amino-6-(5-phosphoribosylamino)uracil reductase RibD [Curtobacterium sp. TXMA1]
MRRALELAALGPAVGDHARVGAVLLSPAGDVLAEGWHKGAGTPHAEVDAMAKVPVEQLRGATAVVTLEPCNHVGRTGPCALALIEAGVGRVVYAIDDPGEQASGGGERLRAAGVDVVSGVLADEAEAFLERWLLSVRAGRPWVTVKWASSLDGRAAAADGTSKWITGAAARQHVHEQRAAHDAILVGTGTVLADDPSLTARGDAGELLADQPLPVVVGDRPVPDDAAVRRHPRGLLTLPGHDLAASLHTLRDHGVHSVLVEGGPTVASALVAAGLVDEVLVYLAPVLLGGPRTAIGDVGVGSIGDRRQLDITSTTTLGPDLLVRARPHRVRTGSVRPDDAATTTATTPTVTAAGTADQAQNDRSTP